MDKKDCIHQFERILGSKTYYECVKCNKTVDKKYVQGYRDALYIIRKGGNKNESNSIK